jgi:predicted ATPase
VEQDGSKYDSIRLFTARAIDVRPDFSVTDENARAVAEICRRLDGLPLSIELAAGRIKLLPPQTLLARLTNSLNLLTGGARDLPARQQTLRDTIAWSYDLLDEAEQRLFRRLAVFVGGCTLEAAEKVCDMGGDLRMDVLDGMASLLDKNLIRQQEGEAPRGYPEPRFDMLETIREYALERLNESGEAQAIRQAHASFYLALAVEAEPTLRGALQSLWMGRLRAEHNNMHAALAWLKDEDEMNTEAARPGTGGAAGDRFYQAVAQRAWGVVHCPEGDDDTALARLLASPLRRREGGRRG